MNHSTERASLLERLHKGLVSNRRGEVLARRVADLMPPGARLLDIGCGNGLVEHLITQHRPDVSVIGVDVRVVPDCMIEVREFDGKTLPFPDKSVDVAMVLDVLHHTENPEILLREAKRVARRAVVVKDHLDEGFMAVPILWLMDWAGNIPYGIERTYMFWTEAQWRSTFAKLGLEIETWDEAIGLYRWPLNLVCERRLHFLARLKVSDQ
jgi:SAM-dependent methyltransferase